MAEAKTAAADKAAVEQSAAARAAEDDTEVDAGQEPEPTTRALSLVKQLEAYVEANGQDVFDEAMELFARRQDGDDERKSAARQRRSAAKSDRGAAPVGRTAPDKKVG